jgi:mono/diheme cytochrome c family protein
LRTNRGGARLAAIAALAAAAISAAACRQDMHDQPKYSALEASPFFADGSSSRPPVPGTVARGYLRDDALLHTGLEGDAAAERFPFPVDEAVMRRGQEMFNAFCSPCHGRTGAGDGMVVQRGFTRPPDLADPRLRDAAPGHFFNVITNGFGAMPEHASQVQVRDRWAIAAYIRALQLSRGATIDDVPAAERGRLQ